MSIERTGAVSGYKSHKEINFESKQTLSALLADFRKYKKLNRQYYFVTERAIKYLKKL